MGTFQKTFHVIYFIKRKSTKIKNNYPFPINLQTNQKNYQSAHSGVLLIQLTWVGQVFDELGDLLVVGVGVLTHPLFRGLRATVSQEAVQLTNTEPNNRFFGVTKH